MVDKGLINFIKHKLEQAVPLDTIRAALRTAGFTDDQIEEGFVSVKKSHKRTHQDIVAAHNFLPPLKKHKLLGKQGFIHSVEMHLFSGRLRRRDFIMGFLFFFGLAVVLPTFALTIISFFIPSIFSDVVNFVTDPATTGWIVLVPIVLAPISCMLLSIATRRLHDIGLPGALSMVFLGYFLPPSHIFPPLSIGAFYITASLLLLLLITKRGVNHTNEHGEVLGLSGSIFARIFNFV